MAPRATLDDVLKKASVWLGHSGIQNTSRNKKMRGAVSAWYELDKKIYPFLYSEITGYALSTWMFLYRITSDERFLRQARVAAGWLVDNALHRDGGVRTRFYLVKRYVSPNYCFHHGRVYAFDTAMVGYGLLQLFNKVKEERFLKAVQQILGFLIRRMKKRDGMYYSYFDSKKKRCGENFEKWSDQAGSFHAKLALLYIDYYRTTGIELYKTEAVDLLDTVIKIQEKNGRFVTGKKDDSTHLHPHAYTLEGLVYGGLHLKEKRYWDAAQRGFEWMLGGISSDGSVSSIFEKGQFSHHERSDIVGQALRLGSILYAATPKTMARYLPLFWRIRRHLAMFQYQAKSGQSGGFIYGFATDGLMRNHLNAWSTMFALQATWMHEAFVVKKTRLCLDHFV